MFGLKVEEPHVAYIGWRAILSNGFIDILPDRGSRSGDEEWRKKLLEWVNAKPKQGEQQGCQPRTWDPRKRHSSKRQVAPWVQLQRDARYLSGSSDEVVEYTSDDGLMVLRATPNSSYGYLYIALFRKEDANEPEHTDS